MPHPRPSSKSHEGLSLYELESDLFPLVASFLPPTDRSASLLALSLSSHHFHDIVIPRILYRELYIEDEGIAVPLLTALRMENEPCGEQHLLKGPIVRSQYIHALSIDIAYSGESKQILHELKMLVQCGGLTNLQSLTIHLSLEWLETSMEIEEDFWTSIQIHCTRITSIRITGLDAGSSARLFECGLSRFVVIGVSFRCR